MREISFRVWDTQYKQWLKDREYSLENNNHIILYNCVQEVIDTFYCGADDSRFIIQQFTELKDANGVDIYEGDIILETWEENRPYSYCPDEWYNQTSKFMVEYNAPSFNFPKRYGDQRSIENYKLEVVGNIFENKGQADGSSTSKN